MRPPAPTTFGLAIQAGAGIGCLSTYEHTSDPNGMFLVGVTFILCVFITSMCYLFWSFIEQ
jgi:hypothetical protein